MRLFIAINFSDTIKKRLIELRDDSCSCSERGNFSLTENLHLTLAFLGECDAKQTAAAKAAADAVSFSAFSLVIDKIGRFKRNGGDIVWAGVRANDTLTALHRELSKRLTAEGFALEAREYNPHITLGREVVFNKPYVFGGIEPVSERVERIDLMKSERVRGKLTYTVYSA